MTASKNFVISHGNVHANGATEFTRHTELFCAAPACSPLILFLFFCFENQEKSAVEVWVPTYIAGVQVRSLGSDQDWCVRDRRVSVLHLLILGFVLFLREIAKAKSYVFNRSGVCCSGVAQGCDSECIKTFLPRASAKALGRELGHAGLSCCPGLAAGVPRALQTST